MASILVIQFYRSKMDCIFANKRWRQIVLADNRFIRRYISRGRVYSPFARSACVSRDGPGR